MIDSKLIAVLLHPYETFTKYLNAVKSIQIKTRSFFFSLYKKIHRKQMPITFFRIRKFRTPKSWLPRLYHESKETIATQKSVSAADAPLSNRDILKLTFEQQVVEQLRQAQLISFQQLVKCLNFVNHEEQLLDILKNVAVVVRGNWVLKSELLFSSTYKSSNGVARDHMCHAYYQILNLFEETGKVTHGHVKQVTQLPANDVTEILCKFAKQVKRTAIKEGHWVFKLPLDKGFLNKYSNRKTEELLKQSLKQKESNSGK